MMRRFCLVAVLSVLSAASLLAATSQDVSLRTDDGVTIAASLYLPSRPGPAVILLHMQTRSREDWNAVASRLVDAGFVVLTLDFRGHGASDPAPAGSGSQDATRLQLDVKAARAFLAARREAIPGRVGIAGASIGANVAALFAQNDLTVRSLVLLSPGLEYRGLRPEAAMLKYGTRPALLITSQEDNYSTNSARKLVTQGTGTRDLRVLNGAGHGTTMLVRQPDLVASLVDWFRRTLL
ncbi:MAG TPA: alpha/beta fold hydrolase [Vicinamibacterales bacterium]|jgi:pimeloyl-ACP methyl ester carboxylesterase